MKKFLGFLLLFSSFLLIYYPALFNFFVQDDFTLLWVSQAKNLKEFLNFFKPLPSGIFYRPLSMQSYFFLIRSLFGLNPLAFHVVTFIFHLLNSLLVYQLMKIITKSKKTAFLISFCFIVSSVHFLSLFWICEFSLVLSTFFGLLSLLSYLKKQQRRFVLFFFLSLLSNEFAATLPLIILSYQFFLEKKVALRNVIIPIIITSLFILLRFFLFPTSLGEFYQPNFSFEQLVSGLRWYLLRSLSLPELIRDYLDKTPLLGINLLTSFVFIVLGFLSPLGYLLKKGKVNFKILLFSFSWFFLSLLPVIFMPKHLSSAYLTLGLPGILLFFLYHFSLLNKEVKKILSVVLLISFFISSLISVRFLEKHHWVVYRAKIAKINLESLLQNYPKINQKIVYFKNKNPGASKELYVAIAGDSAVKVFYKNPDLKVFFEDFNKINEEEIKQALVVEVISL